MKIAIVSLALFAAAPAFAQDASVGENEFKKCKACHMIQDGSGEDIVKGGKIGPNLWNSVGRKLAAQEDYRYSDSMIAAAEEHPDFLWTEEELAAYITDPSAWLAEKTGDSKAKSKMTYKARDKQADVAAYLASVSPDAPKGEGEDATEAPASN